MYTSDKNEIIHYADGMLHDAFIFLAAGIFCAVFGQIYEIFSHEVYSFYMIYAFLIPLVPGAFLNLLIVWRIVRKERRMRISEAAARNADREYAEQYMDRYAAAGAEASADAAAQYEMSERAEKSAEAGVFFPGRFTRHAWNSGLAALTVGCIFQGVLEIYGTTNKLIVVYPITAAVLLCVAVFSFAMSYAAIRKMRKNVDAQAA